MTAVVSVPVAPAALVGGDLCRGKPGGVPSKETPRRVYFLVPLLDLKDRGPLYLRPEVEVQWFMTRDEAMAWADADARVWEVVQ